jgi:methylthioxylose transferase
MDTVAVPPGGVQTTARRRGSIPKLGAAVAVATVAVGAVAHATGTTLGAPLPPFSAHWDPDVAPAAAIAAAALATAVLGGPLLIARASPAQFAAATFAVGLATRLALGAARDGPARWSAVFGSDVEAHNEYLPALAAVRHGVRTFLDRFAELAVTLPIHPSAHPPGVLLSLHVLGIDTAEGAAALAIAGGALAVPAAYLLARSLLEERRARLATLLTLLAPSSLIYGVTSFDALFAALGTAAAALLVARPRSRRAAGAAALALASFFSFALLAVGLWATIVVAQLRGAASALRLAAWCAAGLVAFYALLYAATGFDPVGTARAASEAYRVGIAGARPYAYWLFGSPVAFAVAAGLPLAWYGLRGLASRRPAAVALAAAVAAAAALGFTKGETERIWVFMVPFLAIAAAAEIPRRAVRPVLAALAAQALAVELLMWTIW